MLLQELDEDGGCRRRCLQAARQMKEDAWCPGSRPVISSHHLQVSVRPPAAEDPGPLWAGGSPRRLLQGWPEPLRRGRGVSVTNSGWGRSGHVCHPTHERSSWRRTDLGPRHLAKVDSPPPALPFPPSLSLCLFVYLVSFFYRSLLSPPFISLNTPTRVLTHSLTPHVLVEVTVGQAPAPTPVRSAPGAHVLCSRGASGLAGRRTLGR